MIIRETDGALCNTVRYVTMNYVRIDTCIDTRYGQVIKTFQHRGLKRLFQQGDPSKVRAEQVGRITDVLAHLDEAHHPADLDLPGYRLHPLKGDMRGRWSISVSGNWRLTFEFKDGNMHVLDYEDHH